MPWEPKPGIPAVMRIGEIFSIAATGDPNWAWLIDWVPYMSQELGSTADFCARGPLTHVEPLTVDDMISPFLPFRVDMGLAIAERLTRMRHAMEDRVFADICQLHVETGETCTPFATLTAQYADGREFLTAPVSIPAGIKKMTSKLISWGPGGTHDLHLVAYHPVGGWGPVTNDTIAYMAPGSVTSHTWTAPLTGFTMYSNSPGTVVEFSWCEAGSFQEHEPVDQEEIPGYVPPATRTYTDIPDVGAELDRLEFKLDQVLAMVVSSTTRITSTVTQAGTEPLDTPAQSSSGTVPLGATGLLVEITGIPSYRSVRVDDPSSYPGLGWLTLRTPWGDYQPRELVHARTIVAPLPPYVNEYVATVDAPMLAGVYPVGSVS